MSTSILNGTKKALDIPEDYDVFDGTILMHINSVFATLTQIGLGDQFGFMIEDATATWEDYLEGDLRLNMVKTYMYLKVRLLFDPPTTGYLVEALKSQAQELEWRLNAEREKQIWIPPVTVIDGGSSLEV